MRRLRVLVCGGRDYQNQDRVWGFLTARLPLIDEIITGGATGADELARLWAVAHRVDHSVDYAHWGWWGKRAGFIRNRKMRQRRKPHVVVAFPGGRGTQDMRSQARRAGIPVIEVEDAP